MSEYEELERDDSQPQESYYVGNNNWHYHKDSKGTWFMKAPKAGYDLGFETTFYNSISDPDFKTEVFKKMENASGQQSMKYNNEWYNIFINNDNPDQTQVSRRSVVPYNKVTESGLEEGTKIPEKPKSQPKQESSGNTSTSTSNKEGKQKRDRSIVDKWKYHKQPLEKAEEEIIVEPFWQIEKGVPPLTIETSEGTFIYTRLNHITFWY